MKATGTRPRINVSADGRGVAGHVGTRLLADVADATGLSGRMHVALARLRQRRRGHIPGRVALDLAVMLADGGEAIADVAVLRDQPDLFGVVDRTTGVDGRSELTPEPGGQFPPTAQGGPACPAVLGEKFAALAGSVGVAGEGYGRNAKLWLTVTLAPVRARSRPLPTP